MDRSDHVQMKEDTFQGSVPGNKCKTVGTDPILTYKIKLVVPLMTPLAIHESQLQTEPLKADDRKLFQKATSMVAKVTNANVLANLEVQILTDTHQVVVTSGDKRNVLTVFRDENGEVQVQTNSANDTLNDDQDQTVVTIKCSLTSVSSEDIHKYQRNAITLTPDDIQMFWLAAMVTPPEILCTIFSFFKVFILTDTRKYQFCYLKQQSPRITVIVKRDSDNRIVYGYFSHDAALVDRLENMLKSWQCSNKIFTLSS